MVKLVFMNYGKWINVTDQDYKKIIQKLIIKVRKNDKKNWF